MLGYFEFGIGVELADCSKMNITTENGSLVTERRETRLDSNVPEDSDTNRPVRRKVLQVLYEDLAFLFVVLRSPVIIQVIQDLDATVKLIKDIAEKTSLAESLDGVQQS